MHDDVRLVRDADGKPVEIAGVWMDITDSKQMEEALQEAHNRLQTLIQAAPLPIAAMDREGYITAVESCRGAYLRLAGSRSHGTA